MAPRKTTPSAQAPYEADRFYAVDLKRLVDWKGTPLCPGQDLEIRGAVLNEINAADIEHARPL